MLFLETVLGFLQFCVAFGVIHKYPFKVKNACYQQHRDVISDDDDVTSLSTCLAICSQNGCCSLFFNEESKRCVTYHVVKHILVPACGWKYAEIYDDSCRVGKPYTPQYPLLCDHGYSYDAERNKCVMYCSAYGSTFSKFSGFYISGFNNNWMVTTSVTNCRSACISSTKFVCRTFEIVGSQCHLSSNTALSKPFYYKMRNGERLWQRHCA